MRFVVFQSAECSRKCQELFGILQSQKNTCIFHFPREHGKLVTDFAASKISDPKWKWASWPKMRFWLLYLFPLLIYNLCMSFVLAFIYIIIFLFIYLYNINIYIYLLNHYWELGKLRIHCACEWFLHFCCFYTFMVLARCFNEAACCISFSVAIYKNWIKHVLLKRGAKTQLLGSDFKVFVNS